MEETQFQQAPQPQQSSQTPNQAPQNNGIDWGGEIQQFFKKDLKSLFINLFKFPASGAQRFLDTSSKSVVAPLCMIVFSFIICTFIPYLTTLMKLGSDFASFVPFSIFCGIGVAPIIFALFITLSLFVLMAIKQKTDILLAFRHSAIHMLLFTCCIVVISILGLFVDGGMMGLFLGGGMLGLKFWSVICMLVAIYAIAMGISAVRQTLQTCDNSGKEGYVWYFSPLVIFLSLWLTMLIVKNF